MNLIYLYVISLNYFLYMLDTQAYITPLTAQST